MSTLAACGDSSASSAGAEASPHPHASAGPSDEKALPLRDGERFVELTMAEPYTPKPPNGGTDEYRCLIIDPQLDEEQFLTGVQYEPDNAEISHHTITFVVPPEGAAGARALDEESPGEGWTCFGQGGLEGSTWADTWTPGAQETLFEQDLGYPVQPGSLLVLQVHYNLLATDGEPAGTDQSSVRLRLTDGTAETVAVDTLPLLAPIELPCLPDESGPLCHREAAVANVHERFGAESVDQHTQLEQTCGIPAPGNTQTCDYQLPVPVTVYGTRGHMHLLGRSITVERNPGTPAAEMLLDVPVFNFDDQALNVFDEPVELQPGETLRVSCTHDAGLRRQLPQLEELPPRYVVWGEGTSDEMCLGMLTAAIG
jgi:hypothetical protein